MANKYVIAWAMWGAMPVLEADSGRARVNGKHKGGEICVNDVTNIL